MYRKWIDDCNTLKLTQFSNSVKRAALNFNDLQSLNDQ